MKFGRVEDLSKVIFQLPADDPANQDVLQKASPEKVNIYIGCPVWGDKGFVGKLYPKKTKNSDYLYYYSRQFNSIELNSMLYRIPPLSTIIKWRETVPEGFKFCPKFPQAISHSKNLSQCKQDLDLFLQTVYEFENCLGMSFLQLPESFHPKQTDELQKLLELLPKDFETAVEVRHREWLTNEEHKRTLFQLLQQLNITAVITDTAGRRDAVHQRLTTPRAFIRFTGNNLHPTDYSRIDEWVARITKWVDTGLNSIYFFVHEPEKHFCADIAAYMIKKINTAKPFKIKPPNIMQQDQQSLF